MNNIAGTAGSGWETVIVAEPFPHRSCVAVCGQSPSGRQSGQSSDWPLEARIPVTYTRFPKLSRELEG